jgi:rhodanese-related sulfurtransferase
VSQNGGVMSARIGVGVLLAMLLSVFAEAGHGNRTLTLDAAYVKAQFDSGRTFATIDLRPLEQYRRGHLPGARSIPRSELAARFDEIPRVDLVVLYCECPVMEVERAYQFLRGHSYRNLGVMSDGFDEWVKRGYPVER